MQQLHYLLQDCSNHFWPHDQWTMGHDEALTPSYTVYIISALIVDELKSGKSYDRKICHYGNQCENNDSCYISKETDPSDQGPPDGESTGGSTGGSTGFTGGSTGDSTGDSNGETDPSDQGPSDGESTGGSTRDSNGDESLEVCFDIEVTDVSSSGGDYTKLFLYNADFDAGTPLNTLTDTTGITICKNAKRNDIFIIEYQSNDGVSLQILFENVEQ